MDVETAIRTRRTHKAYGAEPVDRETLTELLDLGRWAPNHHLTNPWRFRVLGPNARDALKEAVGPEGATKLDRAPTLVAVSYVRTPDDPGADEEDLLAAGCAAYAVLLGAHARGLAAYWRTIGALNEPAGRAAIGLPEGEHCIGLLHFGTPRQEQRVPDRAPLADVLRFLD
ncbi:MAG TPA: nitroreductase [Baekduia sp.]|uniref:nitroreductase family protein n=1 Tax=Baekduia sp. TaxID=2600305 RepID=UPI002C2EEC60|nr:nitroreductase [Baekduia sp.]HMJ33845.1 nitroreductase [Baekduia sp.]